MGRTDRDHHEWRLDLGAFPRGKSTARRAGGKASAARSGTTRGAPPAAAAGSTAVAVDAALWGRRVLPVLAVALLVGAAAVGWHLMDLRDQTELLQRSTAERVREAAVEAGRPIAGLTPAMPAAETAPQAQAQAAGPEVVLMQAAVAAGPASAGLGVEPPTRQRPQARRVENAPGGTPVTKCIGAGRTTYVQDGHCPPGQSPADLHLRPLNAAEAPVRNAPTRPAVPGASPARPASSAGARAAAVGGNRTPAAKANECAALARRVEAIDVDARQPHSAAGQDRLAERRRALRSRQAQLGC